MENRWVWAPSLFFRFDEAVLLRGAGVLARPVCLPVRRSPRSVGRPSWSVPPTDPVGRSVGRWIGPLISGSLNHLSQP